MSGIEIQGDDSYQKFVSDRWDTLFCAALALAEIAYPSNEQHYDAGKYFIEWGLSIFPESGSTEERALHETFRALRFVMSLGHATE